MKKSAVFEQHWGEGWPSLDSMRPFFLPSEFTNAPYAWTNDSAGLSIHSLEGTENLAPFKDRIDVNLFIWSDPSLRVLLMYEKRGGSHNKTYSSKGDMRRIREWVRTQRNDARPVGLYIPFAEAWKAVKEFMETEGALPKCIEWVKNEDLPENTFPDPHLIVLPGEKPVSYLTPEEAAAAIALGHGKT